MQKTSTRIIAILIYFLFTNLPLTANHLPGNYLTVQYTGTTDIFIVKLVYYRDCQALPATMQTTVKYSIIGDPITSIILPLYSSTTVPLISCTPMGFTTCANGSGVEENIYQTTVVLTQPGNYRFFNEACCRSFASTYNNNAPVYVEAILDIQSAPDNSLPDFLSTPQFYFCLNNPSTYQSQASDIDGDSIVYSLTPALDNTFGTPAGIQYTLPYSHLNFISSSTPIVFNPVTSTATFTPNLISSGVVVFKAEEYRNGILIGSIMRETNVFITNGTVDVNEITNDLPYIYPNPVKNNIYLSGEYKMEQWIISDISGRVLKIGNSILIEGIHSIPANDLVPGIYLIQLNNENKRVTIKFIKE